MPHLAFPLRLLATACVFLSVGLIKIPAQIAGSVDTTRTTYTAKGMSDQPFTVEVLNARRTVSNSLLVRLALTNLGAAPIRAEHDFSGNDNPADANTIASLYAVDPNGRRKYTVLRDAAGRPLCSRVVPELKPGERRMVYAQLLAPPDTSSSVEIVFPKADPIPHVPIGLPESGEPLPPDAGSGNPTGVLAPATPVPVTPPPVANPTSNNLPDVYTNQTELVGSGTPRKGIGSLESGNSVVPFTVEAVDLRTSAAGAVLRLAITNNGSGTLDATGQFDGGVGATGDPHEAGGVYLVDAASKQRFQAAQTTKLDPALGPGERRTLEAHFPSIPAGVKSVYVYFPHTAPISGVPVSR